MSINAGGGREGGHWQGAIQEEGERAGAGSEPKVQCGPRGCGYNCGGDGSGGPNFDVGVIGEGVCARGSTGIL